MPWGQGAGLLREMVSQSPSHPLSLLCAPLSTVASVPTGADYGQISEETWAYLSHLYGGGPEIAMRQGVLQPPEPESLHSEQKIEAETRTL